MHSMVIDTEAAAELLRLHDLVTEDSILLRRQRDEIAQLGQALAKAIERNNELVEALRQIEPILARMYGAQAADLPPMQIVRAALAKVQGVSK